MSILGPLTTTFTPPSSCISSMSDVFYQILAPSAFDGLLYGPLGAVCFPSGYQDIRRVYYSPGLFCPVGSFACNYETILYWETTLGCTSAFTTFSRVATVLSGGTILSTTLVTGGSGALNALSVAIRFQSTDFDSSTTSTTQQPPYYTETPSPSYPSTSQPTGPGSSNAGGGLSAGAGVGIGIGTTIGLLALIGAIGLAFFFGRRSSQRRERTNTGHNNETTSARLHGHGNEMLELPHRE
ncbi:hypothetical protein V8E54_008674 [Elaphomyces granulatus]